jgi:hypothetical protein
VIAKISWLYLARPPLGLAGQQGTGVLHFKDIKAYAVLHSRKPKKSSTTIMYANYTISRSLLHWETQFSTALDSPR